jgi:hypothetical protein
MTNSKNDPSALLDKLSLELSKFSRSSAIQSKPSQTKVAKEELSRLSVNATQAVLESFVANRSTGKAGKGNANSSSNASNLTTVYCRKSGLPLAVDSYFGNSGGKLRFSEHWIFNQNPGEILRLSLVAHSVAEKYLCQLAMLNAMQLVDFRTPATLTDTQVKRAHRKVVNIFAIWLKTPISRRNTLVGGIDNGFPQLATTLYPYSDYRNFLDLIENKLASVLMLNDLQYAEELLSVEEMYLPEFDLKLKQELRAFERKNPNRYTKKVGRELLEGLAKHPANNAIRNNYKTLYATLLNETFHTSESMAIVYQHILEAESESAMDREYRKLTLDYIASQVELILDVESGFFGKKVFEPSTGKIIRSSTAMELADIDSFINEGKEKSASKLQMPNKTKRFNLKIPKKV